MNKAPRTSQPHNDNQTLPLEIYLPLVTSLYKDPQTLLVGTIVVTGSIFVTYWKTGDTVLLYCAVAFVLVACARGLLARTYSFERQTITSDDVANDGSVATSRARQCPSVCLVSGVTSHFREAPILSPTSSALR
jgi:hypothetical protein